MKSTSSQSLSQTSSAISDLIEQSLQLNLEFLQTLSESSISLMNQMISESLLRRLIPQIGSIRSPMTGSGHIPAPCWMPKSIGEVTCHVCPGGTATVRMNITNGGMTKQDIQVEAVSKTPGVTISPPNLTLGSMEHDWVTVSLPISAEASGDQEYEVLVWVRGCHSHYLRWTVKVSSRGTSCCHEVEVEDFPDHVHHWYDHFYCERPCRH